MSLNLNAANLAAQSRTVSPEPSASTYSGSWGSAAERFNRTIQEEFVGYHEVLLFTDPLAFNVPLYVYLLWFYA